jgi:hypothetical protein
MNRAQNGTFIFICTEDVQKSIGFLKKAKAESEEPGSQLFALSKVS